MLLKTQAYIFFSDQKNLIVQFGFTYSVSSIIGEMGIQFQSFWINCLT
jgi:hypothetical protein